MQEILSCIKQRRPQELHAAIVARRKTTWFSAEFEVVIWNETIDGQSAIVFAIENGFWDILSVLQENRVVLQRNFPDTKRSLLWNYTQPKDLTLFIGFLRVLVPENDVNKQEKERRILGHRDLKKNTIITAAFQDNNAPLLRWIFQQVHFDTLVQIALASEVEEWLRSANTLDDQAIVQNVMALLQRKKSEMIPSAYVTSLYDALYNAIGTSAIGSLTALISEHQYNLNNAQAQMTTLGKLTSVDYFLSPFLYSIVFAGPDVALFILKQPGVLVNKPNRVHKTALYLALLCNKPKMVFSLLQHGALIDRDELNSLFDFTKLTSTERELFSDINNQYGRDLLAEPLLTQTRIFLTALLDLMEPNTSDMLHERWQTYKEAAQAFCQLDASHETMLDQASYLQVAIQVGSSLLEVLANDDELDNGDYVDSALRLHQPIAVYLLSRKTRVSYLDKIWSIAEKNSQLKKQPGLYELGMYFLCEDSNPRYAAHAFFRMKETDPGFKDGRFQLASLLFVRQLTFINNEYVGLFDKPLSEAEKEKHYEHLLTIVAVLWSDDKYKSWVTSVLDTYFKDQGLVLAIDFTAMTLPTSELYTLARGIKYLVQEKLQTEGLLEKALSDLARTQAFLKQERSEMDEEKRALQTQTKALEDRETALARREAAFEQWVAQQAKPVAAVMTFSGALPMRKVQSNQDGFNARLDEEESEERLYSCSCPERARDSDRVWKLKRRDSMTSGKK